MHKMPNYYRTFFKRFSRLDSVVIVLSITVTLSMAIRFQWINESKVLGIKTEAASALLVRDVLASSLLSQINNGLTGLIFVLIMSIGAMMIYQFIVVLKKLGSDKKFGLSNIIRIIALDIVIFVMTVLGIATFNRWSIERDTPEELRYERLTNETVSVKWKSASSVMSQVLWGYGPEHLDNIALGTNGEERTNTHEVVFQVIPNEDIFFKIVADGVKYGEGGTTGFYHLYKSNRPLELIDLPTKSQGERVYE